MVLCFLPTWIVLSELEHSHEVKVTDEVTDEARENEVR